MTGSRREKIPACSETPAPVGLVELAELKVSVAMVVALRLEPPLVEFPPAVGSVVFWETTCWQGGEPGGGGTR